MRMKSTIRLSVVLPCLLTFTTFLFRNAHAVVTGGKSKEQLSIDARDTTSTFVMDVGDADTLYANREVLRDVRDAPGPRMGHTATLFGKKLFVFGGKIRDEESYNELHMFDTENNEWESLSPLQKPRFEHTATLVLRSDEGDKPYIYILGGKTMYNSNGVDDTRFLNDLQILDPKTRQWISPAPTYGGDSIMDARAGHTTTLVGDKLFVFGGYNSHGLVESKLWMLSVNPDRSSGKFQWSTLPNVSGNKPQGRVNHVATFLLGRYYVVLGGYDASDMTLGDVHVLDVASGKYEWNMPEISGGNENVVSGWSLAGHSAVKLKESVPGDASAKEVMFFGGCNSLQSTCASGDGVVSVLGAHPNSDGSIQWKWKNVVWKSKTDDLPRFEQTATILPSATTQNTVLVYGGCALDESSQSKSKCFSDVTRIVIAHKQDVVKEIAEVEPESEAAVQNEPLQEQLDELEEAKAKGPDAVKEYLEKVKQSHPELYEELAKAAEEEEEEPPKKEEPASPVEDDVPPELAEQLDLLEEAKAKGDDAVKEYLETVKESHPELYADLVDAAEEDEEEVEAPPGDEPPPEIEGEGGPESCPLECSGHGTCTDTRCECDVSDDGIRGYYGAGCEYLVDKCVVSIDTDKTATTPDGKIHVFSKDRRVRVAVSRPNGRRANEKLYVAVPIGKSDVPLVAPVAQQSGKLWSERVYLFQSTRGEKELQVRSRVRPLVESELTMPAIEGDDTIEVKVPFKLVKGSVLLIEDTLEIVEVDGVEEDGTDVEVTLASPLQSEVSQGSRVFLTQIAPPPLPLPLVCDKKEAELVEAEMACDCNTHGGTCVRHDGEGVAPTCQCFPGWAGDRCEKAMCPNNCTHALFGACTDGAGAEKDADSWCRCEYGYSGKDCGKHAGCGDLGRNCSKNAFCVETTFSVQTKGEGETLDIVTGECKCFPGWSGAYCKTPVCMNNCSGTEHGRCVPDESGRSRQCECKHPYQGLDCSRSEVCPKNCSDHGSCDSSTGTCTCDRGWVGDACDTLSMCGSLNRCNGNGRCVAGECVCRHGYTGKQCEKEARCPLDCSNAGVCIAGTCHCTLGRAGPACGSIDGRFCPKNCSGHGKCHMSECFCDPGFDGDACENMVACPRSGSENKICGGNGICKFGRCFCGPSYGGPACEPLNPCPKAGEENRECSGKGYCVDGTCFCSPGFHGEACQRGSNCAKDCSRHGLCYNGQCMCDVGFTGEDCSVPEPCPMGMPSPTSSFSSSSTRNATTDDDDAAPSVTKEGAEALAHPSTAESFLEIFAKYNTLAAHGPSKPKNGPGPEICSGQGRCIRGQCYCAPGFSGKACNETRPCPELCHLHGKCQGELCVCDQGYRGIDCTERVQCPANCHDRGVCYLGTCACTDGFAGRACEHHVPCPNDCSGNGDCVAGKCICDGDWSGRDCSFGGHMVQGHIAKECETDCSGHGLCDNGKCVCNIGWEGGDCAREMKCPNECSGHGLCWHGDCYCDPGYEGASCLVKVDCPVAKPESSTMLHFDGAHGGEGEDPTAVGVHFRGVDPLSYNHDAGSKCSGHGVCQYGKCFCGGGWAGDACETNKLVELQLRMANSTCPVGVAEKTCSGHGQCFQGQCDCTEGWYGENCGQNTVEGPCPNACSGRGVCGREGDMKDKCLCESGWEGMDCSKRTPEFLSSLTEACARTCSEHGVCQAGTCVCKTGWEGDNCDVETCPDSCTIREDGSSQGECIESRCVCFPGFAGDNCAGVCPDRCSGHGVCSQHVHTVNSSDVAAVHGETVGKSEMIRRDNFHCMCSPGWTGESCGSIAVTVSSMEASGITLRHSAEKSASGSSSGLSSTKSTGDDDDDDDDADTTLASSIVLVAIGTFAIGLVAVPIAKVIMDRRNSQISKKIIETQSSLEQYIY